MDGLRARRVLIAAARWEAPVTVGSRADIDRAVATLPHGAWLRLSTADGTRWVQAYLQGTGVFVVEQYDGGTGEHVEAFAGSPQVLADALADWFAGGATWRGALDWTPIRPSAAAEG